MKPVSHPRRGGILKMLLILILLLVAAGVVIYLIATRGAEMQQDLQDKGKEIRDKVGSNSGGAPERATSPQPPAAQPAPGTDDPARGGAARTANKPPASSPERPVYTVKRPPPVQKTWHTVSKGETLYSIAETYYENGTLWKLLADANGLKDTSDLKEGMLILIPGK